MQKAISKYWPVFVLPTLLAFIIGFIWPFIWGIYLSFQRFTTVSKTTFVGIQNYINVFQDSTFLHAFGFTAAFTVVSTVLINVCAFAIALVLTRGIRGTNIFRTVYFMPNLIGGILLGYIWQILLNGVLANLQKPLLALDAKAGFVGLVLHPLRLCMPLLSLCLDQRTNVILPRLSGIVNVVFIFCAIQNILTSIQPSV